MNCLSDGTTPPADSPVAGHSRTQLDTTARSSTLHATNAWDLGPGTRQCLDLRFHKLNSHGLSHGQHTCPGMFLAINDLLLKQDLSLVEGKVSQTENLEGIVPISDKTKLSMERRAEAIPLDLGTSLHQETWHRKGHRERGRLKTD